ncbi:AraC family transcriptional regulator [Solirubrobacter sp. CPCC 204708]|uniref:AraC family transcriptional regulator n=1 Tax=Solirubrobacter deserti TaxID=2282478 RepID=A0ABT4RIN7_9ACTN|nr:AraC family transcriptional regulator [Solirubrobacter deserti]MBE2318780.1 AraC family transcriptional regulator [Solirubrobacter deserti]MDA0138160.1 AraC family transcriptional regulator [Solirubrobacter deserti]
MDAIAGLLDGPRARGAFLLRSTFTPPWGLRLEDESPLTLNAVVSGTAWITPAEGDPVQLHPGDIAITRGPDHWTMGDRPHADPQAIILPGQECVAPDGQPMKLLNRFDTRSWGMPGGDTIMLTGVYEHAGEISTRLLRALPPLLVERLDSPLVPLLSDEIIKDQPGQEAVLDRLLDLLLIATLRAYFSRPEAPGWYRAYADPIVGPAIKMLHTEPAHPWTIAELARRIGVSRAALARRFNDLVGEPPMSFLTGWRIALAADLLLEPGATVGSVAPQVGYGSSFALSTAFKRLRGISPQEHRLTAT